MTEHSADLLNTCRCGEDGRTAYRRWKEKDFQGQVVEFGEKVHHRNNSKGENARRKMDGRWHEGYYLGKDWRTGSAWIGTSAGVIKASVIRRTGAHRRWDQEGLLGVQCTPWKRVPAAEDEYSEIIIEPLPEAERRAVPLAEDHRRLPRRIMLRKDHFVQHGFTAKCPGCRVLLSGASQRSHGRHTEECRKRMEKVLEETPVWESRPETSS